MFSDALISSLVALLAFGVYYCAGGKSEGTIVLSFDGFNDEFLDGVEVLAKDGTIGKLSARPKLMKSVNITKTLPTHHTVSTGVLPNVHGVVANHMFGANGNILFNNPEQYSYDKTLMPLWIVSQTKSIKSACMMWPGCEFTYNGKKADYVTPYNPSTSWEKRIDTIVEWAVEDTADLILGYFEDNASVDVPDNTPNEVFIKKVVDAIEYLQSKLDEYEKSDSFDIIIMSDHGTKTISKNQVFNIDKLKLDCDIIASGPVVFLKSKSGDTSALLKTLETADINEDGKPDKGSLYNVYDSNDAALAEWNLNGLPHLKNVIFLTTLGGNAIYRTDKYNKIQAAGSTKENGYSQKDRDMDGILYLKGPTFKNAEFTSDSVELTEVHPLITNIMRIDDKTDYAKLKNVRNLIEPSVLATWKE